MKFEPLYNDVEYFGIDVLNNQIISKKIYYKKETAEKNVVNNCMLNSDINNGIKLFDYSKNDEKESFGYLVYVKISSLFKSHSFSPFFNQNKVFINFIEEICGYLKSYPPVLGIKYLNKQVTALGLYSNPPYDEEKYIEQYYFIRNKFLTLYPNSDYENLLNFLDKLVNEELAYLYLFGFDATLSGSQKFKFYLHLQSDKCIRLLKAHLINKYNFNSDFINKIFFLIAQNNNSHIDIIAFSFIQNKLCLNVYYRPRDK